VSRYILQSPKKIEQTHTQEVKHGRFGTIDTSCLPPSTSHRSLGINSQKGFTKVLKG